MTPPTDSSATETTNNVPAISAKGLVKTFTGRSGTVEAVRGVSFDLEAGRNLGDERAVLGDAGVVLVFDGVLIERARRKVAMHFRDADAEFLEMKHVVHVRCLALRMPD